MLPEVDPPEVPDVVLPVLPPDVPFLLVPPDVPVLLLPVEPVVLALVVSPMVPPLLVSVFPELLSRVSVCVSLPPVPELLFLLLQAEIKTPDVSANTIATVIFFMSYIFMIVS